MAMAMAAAAIRGVSPGTPATSPEPMELDTSYTTIKTSDSIAKGVPDIQTSTYMDLGRVTTINVRSPQEKVWCS